MNSQDHVIDARSLESQRRRRVMVAFEVRMMEARHMFQRLTQSAQQARDATDDLVLAFEVERMWDAS